MRPTVIFYTAALLLIAVLLLSNTAHAQAKFVWNQQSILSYSQFSGSEIQYIANATPQAVEGDIYYSVNGYSDSCNCGNGNTHCWFQYGLDSDPSVDNGNFYAAYETWCGGYSVFPKPEQSVSCDGQIVYNGGSGSLYFSGPVNANDPVELSLLITKNNVLMEAVDQNTGAYADIASPGYGVTSFSGVGQTEPSGPSDPQVKGEFSGPMTEWQHKTDYESNGNPEVYTPITPVLKSDQAAWTDVEEASVNVGANNCDKGGRNPAQETQNYFSESLFPLLPKPYYIQPAYADGTGAGDEYFGNGTFVTGVNDIGIGSQDTMPYGVVFSPDGLYAYVDNQGSDTVSVIDVQEEGLQQSNVYAIVNTISLDGQTPWGIAISPDGSRLYVAIQQGERASIDIIATPNRTIIGSIPIPASGLDEPSSVAPQDMVVNPQGTYLFGRATGQEIEKISLTTNTFVGNYPSPFTFSSSIAIDPTGTYLYAPNIWHGDSILIGLAILEVINAQTLTAGQNVTIPYQTGVNGHGVAIDSNGDGYWTYSGADVNYDPNPMSYLADLSGQTVFSVSGSELYNIAIDPNSGAAYVVGCGSSGAATYWPDPTSGEIYSTTGLVINLPDCPSVIGNTPWENSYSFNPESLAIDPNANLTVGYIADYNGRIIAFNTKTGNWWYVGFN